MSVRTVFSMADGTIRMHPFTAREGPRRCERTLTMHRISAERGRTYANSPRYGSPSVGGHRSITGKYAR